VDDYLFPFQGHPASLGSRPPDRHGTED
jgi:hypothetical protein